ncbi:MAG: alpha/beta hydrolase [Planctomycetota bacterium]
MFVVTNRTLNAGGTGLKKFGDRPNPQGPNELRLVEASRSSRGWDVKILPDECTQTMKRSAGLELDQPAFASAYVAKKLLARVRKQKRNVLFFVHGYNNNMKAVLDRAHELEKTYDVEVIAFSWPANGGGARGVASYLSDKADARASAGALSRCLAKLHEYLDTFNRERLAAVYAKADALYGPESKGKHKDDFERRDEYISTHSERGCPFTVNLMLHSMGNYLYKQVMCSSAYQGRLLTFDNVVMVAADTNNANHACWVDPIRARNRVYITINESDRALRASRIKSGQEQLARLGHFPFNLYAESAVYVDFTDARYVGSSHAYFEGGPLQNNKVRRFFAEAFNGDRAERRLDYESATNTYRIS